MSHQTKKPQPNLSRDEASALNPSFLDGLDLDLEDIMSQAEIDTAIEQTKREKQLQGKLKPKTSTPAEPPKPKPSPWRATKVILLVQETQCRCGETFLHPAAKMPLAHFQHVRKPDTIWEVASHPSTLNPDLPRETRMLIDSVEACPNCFNKGDK